MGGGAWPFLVGGAICLVNSDNERDSFLLTGRFGNRLRRLGLGITVRGFGFVRAQFLVGELAAIINPLRGTDGV